MWSGRIQKAAFTPLFFQPIPTRRQTGPRVLPHCRRCRKHLIRCEEDRKLIVEAERRLTAAELAFNQEARMTHPGR